MESSFRCCWGLTQVSFTRLRGPASGSADVYYKCVSDTSISEGLTWAVGNCLAWWSHRAGVPQTFCHKFHEREFFHGPGWWFQDDLSITFIEHIISIIIMIWSYHRILFIWSYHRIWHKNMNILILWIFWMEYSDSLGLVPLI